MTNADSVVSVVIPTFNRSKLVIDALDSVKAQLLRPLDIIVVDDGSTDDTEATVSAWKAVNESHIGLSIRYFKQDNEGGNVARNRGIAEANGAYIAFLDSDDRWHPAKLQKQLAVLEDNPDIGAVYCGVQHVDLETNQVTEPVDRTYPQGRILEQMLIKDVTAPTSTYLVRKVVFDDVGNFDTELKARQDWDMWIRVAAGYEIACVPEPLVDFREHTGARTASDPNKEIEAYTRIRQKYATLLARCSFPVRQAAKAAYYRRMGRVAFHYQHARGKAMVNYLLAIVAWPFVFDSYAALAGVLLPAGLRGKLHRGWNRVFGKTSLAIRSH